MVAILMMTNSGTGLRIFVVLNGADLVHVKQDHSAPRLQLARSFVAEMDFAAHPCRARYTARAIPPNDDDDAYAGSDSVTKSVDDRPAG